MTKFPQAPVSKKGVSTQSLVIIGLLITNALLVIVLSTRVEYLNDSVHKNVQDNVHKNDEALSIDIDDNPFAYDIDQWRAKHPKQRIVFLAGPHKTGTSGVQYCFASFAGLSVDPERNLTGNALRKFHPEEKILQPHPAFADWIWPSGTKEEYVAMGVRDFHKFYYPLTVTVAGEKDADDSRILTYYRRVLDIPWKQGHNLVVGTEGMDTVLRGLAETKDDPVVGGEEIHAYARAAERIDRLVKEVLPAHPSSSNSDGNSDLSHIEIQVGHRIPRIDHLASVWKEIAQYPSRRAENITMRELFGRFKGELVVTNGLALALQLVRRGIRVTLIVIDTRKKKSGNDVLLYNQNKANESESIIGGFYGSVGCEILELGKGVCDHENRMHLERIDGRRRYSMANSGNSRDESSMSRNMTEAELDQIDDYMNEYDCSVWKYLRQYQAKDLLRVLNPSPGLFDDCDYHMEDVSFYSIVERITQVVAGI